VTTKVDGKRDSELNKLSELIKDIPVAMLTTVDEDEYVRSRPTTARAPGADGMLWFFTRAVAGRLHDVEAHPRVNVAYVDAVKQHYISVSGRARLLRDRARIQELWTQKDLTWLPDGPEDPQLALIAVEVDAAEYWDPAVGAMVHVVGIPAAEHARLEPARRI
jgi:general stress protein 26